MRSRSSTTASSRKRALEAVVLDRDRSLVGERGERLDLVDGVRLLGRRAHGQGTDAAASAAQGCGEMGRGDLGTHEALEVVPAQPPGRIEGARVATPGRETKRSVGPRQHEQRDVGPEERARIVDDSLQDGLQLGQRGQGQRDAMQGARGGVARLELRVPFVEDLREVVEAAEGKPGARDREDGHHRDHHHRVPGEGQDRIQDAVADQLDEADRDDGERHVEPAPAREHHRVSLGRLRAWTESHRSHRSLDLVPRGHALAGAGDGHREAGRDVGAVHGGG